MSDAIVSRVSEHSFETVWLGKMRLLVGDGCGAIVERALEQQSVLLPRARPVLHRPAKEILWGRTEELESVLRRSNQPLRLEITGAPGVGKSAFLARLSHASWSASFPDGVVFERAWGCTTADVLRGILFRFFEPVAQQNFHPTDDEVRTLLREVRALVCIDDLDPRRCQLHPHDLESLLFDALPHSGIIFTNTERQVFSPHVEHMGVEPIVDNEAELVWRRLWGRELSATEREVARTAYRHSGGKLLVGLRVLHESALDRTWGDLPGDEVFAKESSARKIRAIKSTSKRRKTEGVLRVVEGAGLWGDALSALVGVAKSELQQALHEGWLKNEGGRITLCDTYTAPEHLAEDELSAKRVLQWFSEMARGGKPQRDTFRQNLPAVLVALAAARQLGLHHQVLASVRSMEAGVALDGRWGAWKQMLEMHEHAAARLALPAERAWALHQLGSRALCMGELDGAKLLLEEAIKIRGDLGDTEGARITRHNLDLCDEGRSAQEARLNEPRASHLRVRPKNPNLRLVLAVAVWLALGLCAWVMCGPP